ncbi:hypothetical protein LYZ96_22355 [Xanthomonas hortorum pv. vitians]|uniref:hypothetical protein n=1 Tax=Xanthomonas hortorum TaxID=56454 RepID=UPI001F1D8BB4|nr:hypothetical protein [Xanthomonas hortorum]MCE4291780.1 hypothetical protein [Xanthomonas hortorum pv. vitians]
MMIRQHVRKIPHHSLQTAFASALQLGQARANAQLQELSRFVATCRWPPGNAAVHA